MVLVYTMHLVLMAFYFSLFFSSLEEIKLWVRHAPPQKKKTKDKKEEKKQPAIGTHKAFFTVVQTALRTPCCPSRR